MSGRTSFDPPFTIYYDLTENAPSNRSVGTLVESEPVLLGEKDQPANFIGVRAFDQVGIRSALDGLVEEGTRDGYHLLHATRAEFLRRLGANAKGVESYRRALSLATNTNEIRFLKERLNTLEGVPDAAAGTPYPT
jgi:hypothetical protein